MTAGPAERDWAEQVVGELGGDVMWVAEEHRSLYHAGLAHGANHLVTLVSQAMELLSRAGADDPAAILRPLLEASLDNALTDGDAALTGPIVRGDVNTVRAHLAEIAATAPDTLRVLRRAGPRHPRPRGDRRARPADPGRDDAPGARRGRGRRRPSGRRAAAPYPPAMTSRPLLASTREELSAALAPRRRSGEPVALVPTMGALHEGHAALLRAARQAAGSGPVVASIFVNPLQFAPGEDLDRYPRTFEADLDLCGREGVDVVFAPAAAEVYPDGEPLVTVEPGPLAAELEGASRPGHFRGVLTVVAKLFGLTRPDLAMFGEKDYQQLVLVRRMSRDLCLGVDVVGVPTVREADGLALSSRNRYLGPDERPPRGSAVAGAARGAGAAAPDGAAAALAAAAAELGGRADRARLPRDPYAGPRRGRRLDRRPGRGADPGGRPGRDAPG